jgi:hypothetical protein
VTIEDLPSHVRLESQQEYVRLWQARRRQRQYAGPERRRSRRRRQLQEWGRLGGLAKAARAKAADHA